MSLFTGTGTPGRVETAGARRLGCAISFGLVIIVDPRQLINLSFKVANHSLRQEPATTAAHSFSPLKWNFFGSGGLNSIKWIRYSPYILSPLLKLNYLLTISDYPFYHAKDQFP